ncbi:MAG: gamma-glutamyl-gamma-aminobutyrate hydrolase family protein [Gammaproteobacteria bacterium]|nr:gamma-glutamyl-gamma-aminobutyrate hydrolase family protein [Gammaproteobacteria bacterium]
MRVLETQGYYEPRDALAHDWSNLLSVALPTASWLPIPNLGIEVAQIYCEKWDINRLILTGGDDIGVSPIRDETEQSLLKWARERAVPVLGVCRGMQMMALSAGVPLKPVKDHVRTRHQLQGDFVHEVNSFHNFGLSDCPLDFEVSAISIDGEIEAIRHSELHWEGWMWHPEREKPFQVADIKRLQRLFA